ncbi:MAG: hypothetical protein QXW70_00690 [Candidatus Anstonellales archaeon]
MFQFDAIKLLAIILLTSFFPALPLTFAILRKTHFHIIEKLLFAFTIGFCLIPLLSFFEFFFFGISFSIWLIYTNILLTFLVGLLACWKIGIFSDIKINPSLIKTSNEFRIQNVAPHLFPHLAPASILVLSFIAFWIRLQSYTPIYQELDPYFYMYGARQIITDGAAPLFDDTAWYPFGKPNHRTAPLTSYLEAQWYLLYTNSSEYYNYLLSVVSSFYPPIVAGLLVFFVYLLISQEYGRRYGLVAGALSAFLPATIIKMAAGVNEIQPFNFFAIFFLFSSYSLAIKYKENWVYYLLTAFAVVVLLFGSNANQIMVLVIPSFTIIYSLFLIYKKENIYYFMILSLLYSFIALVSTLMFDLYQLGKISDIPYQYLFSLAISVLFCAIPYYLQNYVKDKEFRIYVVGGIVLVALVGVAFTPLFSKFLEAGRGAVSTISFEQPLTRTIQEQGIAGGSFEGEAGLLAANPRSVKIPYLSFLDNFVQTLVLLFAVPSTQAINTLLSILDFAVGVVFGLQTKTIQKDVSLGMFFLFGSFLAILFAFVRSVQRGYNTHRSDLFALYALIIFPISYVGLNRTKYTIFFALMLVLAATILIAEFEIFLGYLVNHFAKLRSWPEEKRSKALKTILFGMFCFAFLFALYSAFSPTPLASSILLESSKVRYQDNPIAISSKFQEICGRLKLVGQYDEEICKAGALDEAFLSDINNQFSSRLCFLSLVSDIFRGPTESERYAASFRCTRISPYWIEVMDWIEHNVSDSDRITSWWDYGHWTNFFGNKKTVLRNEHTSPKMIGMIASAFIAESPEDLAKKMQFFDSRYLMLDQEIISGGGYSFGGKFGALNYLSCANLNQTDVSRYPGESDCEFEHTWESVYVPRNPSWQEKCTISFSQNIRGTTAYVPIRQKTSTGTQTILAPRYCIGQAKMADGSINPLATYKLDTKTQSGDLVLNKALLFQPVEQTENFYIFHSFYTKDNIWPGQNGTAASGWEDRKGKFYDSVLYQGFYLKELPGFELVYETKEGEVKIYRLINFTSPFK